MTSLECDHCGGDAISSESGLFADGDGERCDTCGYPGTVSVDDSDEDALAYWNSSIADDARCNLEDCEDCRELDAETAEAKGAKGA